MNVGRVLFAAGILVAAAHVIAVENFSGTEIRRLEVPVSPQAAPSENRGSLAATASARVQLAPGNNPMRALCEVDYSQVSVGNGTISRSVGGYFVRLTVRTPSDSWSWSRVLSSTSQTGVRGVQETGGMHTIAFGSFEVPAEGDYIVDVKSEDARFVRSMTVVIRSNVRKYDAWLLGACGVVALLGLIMAAASGKRND